MPFTRSNCSAFHCDINLFTSRGDGNEPGIRSIFGAIDRYKPIYLERGRKLILLLAYQKLAISTDINLCTSQEDDILPSNIIALAMISI